jgi:hypothetical protein
MQPLKPETKLQILQTHPNATAEDIAEYERLLSERFTVNPLQQKSPEQALVEDNRTRRLRELKQLLFSEPEQAARPQAQSGSE